MAAGDQGDQTGRKYCELEDPMFGVAPAPPGGGGLPPSEAAWGDATVSRRRIVFIHACHFRLIGCLIRISASK